jgi:hypothetical protein
VSISSRIKEFETNNPKKNLCCIKMCQLLLKLFNLLHELNGKNQLDSTTCDRIELITECVPDQKVGQMMLLKEIEYNQNLSKN